MHLSTNPQIASAERSLGLLWVILLGLRYRTENPGDLTTMRELCDRLAPGVPGCNEYNAALAKVLVDVRGVCAGTTSDRVQRESLVSHVDVLQRLLKGGC